MPFDMNSKVQHITKPAQKRVFVFLRQYFGKRI